MIVYLRKSTNRNKKFMVNFDNSHKTVHFGAAGYSDFTIHKDIDRKKRYIERHRLTENWTKSGITTAGFWSLWLLWNKPTLLESIKYTEKKFKIKIIRCRD